MRLSRTCVPTVASSHTPIPVGGKPATSHPQVVRRDAVGAHLGADAGVDEDPDAVVVDVVGAEVGPRGLDAQADPVAGDLVGLDHGGGGVVGTDPDGGDRDVGDGDDVV